MRVGPAAGAHPSEGKVALLGVAHMVQSGILAHGQGSTHLHQKPLLQGWKVVLDHLPTHEALAVVPGFRGSVHHVPELEACGMFVPQFLLLGLLHSVLGLVGKQQVTRCNHWGPS